MTSSNGRRHPRLLNLTPHPIRLVTIDGHLVQLPAPNDPVPRIAAPTPPPSLLHTTIGVFNWHQMTTPPTVLGLPDQQAGVLLVVSRPVALAAPDRPDLIVPDQQHRRPDGLTTHAAALTTYPTHHTSPRAAQTA